jgi:CheY-like chemotaxis protein
MPGSLLVVDDELIVRELVAAHFRARGWTAAAAADGRAALEVLARERCDVLVTDLEMPGLDGWGLMREVRSLAPLVRIVVLTCHGSLAEITGALEAGAFSFVCKPLDDLAPLEEAVGLAERVAAGWRRQMAQARSGVRRG